MLAQSVLQQSGYYQGPIDGNFNNSARQALMRFQKDDGLEVTGELDDELFRRLLALRQERAYSIVDGLMTSKRLILLTATLLFVACSPAPPPSSILAPEHVTINLQVVAATFSGKVVPATPNKWKSSIFMNGAPEHLQFAFDNDHLSGVVRYRERQLLLYPINAYRELFRRAPKEQANFNKEIKLLQQFIVNSSESVTEAIPVLPPVETIQLFCSQIRYLNFADGAGVRFVTRYAMEASPTTNENIFYTFQGLTSDGRYYISVFYPITAKGLPETAVILTTINFLNRLASADFTPDLAKLDDMIKSLRVVEPVQ
jgi:hypothetical protein